MSWPAGAAGAAARRRDTAGLLIARWSADRLGTGDDRDAGMEVAGGLVDHLVSDS